MTKYRQVEIWPEKNNNTRNPYNKRVIWTVDWVKNDVARVSKKINYTTEQIEKELWNNMVKSRITYLRHFPYDETRKEVKEYNILLEKLRNKTIEESEKTRINELSSIVDKLICTDFKEMKEWEYFSYEQIRELFQNPSKTLLAYYDSDEWMQRCRITWDALSESFWIWINNKQHVHLPWSDKTVDTGKEYAEKTWEISKVVSELEEINQDNKYENIIIIWNRSYSHWMTLLLAEWNISLRWSITRFEEELYDYIDYNSNHKKIYNKDILKVTLSNYLKLKQIFPEIEHEWIIDFQNKLNVYFIKNPVLFKKYVFSFNEELRVFCLVNLITNWEFEYVYNNLKKIFKLKSDKEIIKLVKIILDSCKNDSDKKTILDYVASISSLLSRLEVGNLEYYANYQTYVIENISDLRKKTLDEKFKVWEVNILSLWFTDKHIKSIEDLIQQNEIILIEWESGTGKSVKLLEIMEYLKPKDDLENKYFPIYVNLGRNSEINDIKWKIRDQKNWLFWNEKYQFVYLFDALDESKYDDETKKKFFKYIKELQNNWWKVIVTSRPGSRPIYKEDEKEDEKIYDSLKKIQLKKFSKEDIENYIKTHLSEDKIHIWNTWINNNKFILDIEDNPLMLSIICNLIESGTNINSIKTKTDLYEKIVEKRLLDYNTFVSSRDVSHRWDIYKKRYNALEKKINKLSEIAYLQLFEWKSFTLEDLEEFMNDENLDMESLNLLFRNWESLEYDFVHQSFKEYFAAKYIFEEIFKNIQNLYKMQLDFKNFINEFWDDKTMWELYEIAKKRGINFDNLFNNSIKTYNFNIEKYDYNLLDFLVDFFKKDVVISKEIVENIVKKAEWQYSISWKHFYILSKLNVNIWVRIFNKYIKNKKSYKDYELIEWVIKSNIPWSAEYIKLLIKLLIKDAWTQKVWYSWNRNSLKSSPYYNFLIIIKLIINTNFEKEIYHILYQWVFLDEDTRFFDINTFLILYKYTDNKTEFLKQILDYSKNNQFIRQDISLLDKVYEIIINNHINNLEYLIWNQIKKDNFEYKIYWSEILIKTMKKGGHIGRLSFLSYIGLI